MRRGNRKTRHKGVVFTSEQASKFELKLDSLIDNVEGTCTLFAPSKLDAAKSNVDTIERPVHGRPIIISVRLRDCSKDHNVVQLLSLGDALPEVASAARHKWRHQTAVERYSPKGGTVVSETKAVYLRPNMRGRTIFQPSNTPLSEKIIEWVITANRQTADPVFTAYFISETEIGLFNSKRVPGTHKSATAMWSAVCAAAGAKDVKKGAELLGLHHIGIVSLLEVVEQQKSNVTKRAFRTVKTMAELDERRQREARASARELIDQAMDLVCPNDQPGLFKSLIARTGFRKQYKLDELPTVEAIMQMPFIKPLIEQYKASNDPAYCIPALSIFANNKREFNDDGFLASIFECGIKTVYNARKHAKSVGPGMPYVRSDLKAVRINGVVWANLTAWSLRDDVAQTTRNRGTESNHCSQELINTRNRSYKNYRILCIQKRL